MEPLESLMTTEDLANYLKLDVVTVRRIVTRGDLAAYRIGGEYRFTRSDIAEFLQRQHIPARPLSPAEQTKLLKPAFDRLTKRAKQAIWRLAAEEARSFKQPQIGAEHLLLGLIAEGEGVAGRVLHDLGITLSQARQAVELTFGVGSAGESGRSEPELGNDARNAIEIAYDEAIRMHHHYIGTEHVLLGLLQESQGNAVKVLECLSVSPEQVRALVMDVLQKLVKP
jgi:excisionase family DNA binding protein